MDENLHKEHRSRVRKKYRENGIESFSPHEVLELLLFYSYRQTDTNEIAHRLLKRFGTISTVFEADIPSLMSVEGVGENTAIFLKLQSDIQRYYMKEKLERKKKLPITPGNVGEYVMQLFYGYTDEMCYMLCLNAECELISADVISRGTVNGLALYSREVVKKALDTKSSFVILAHNHPSGMLAPSDADVETTKVIYNALSFINVKLVDHIIVSNNKYISIFNDYNIF